MYVVYIIIYFAHINGSKLLFFIIIMKTNILSEIRISVFKRIDRYLQLCLITEVHVGSLQEEKMLYLIILINCFHGINVLTSLSITNQ